jgi:mono/diheme cytochrome c family protein
MKENRYLAAGLGLIMAGIIGVVVVRLFFMSSFGGGMGPGMMGGMMGSGMMGGMMEDMMKNMKETNRKTEFSSNGERIFYTGINSKGEAIKNSHGMQGVGCAMCHGEDGKGMRMMMMDVPALRWDVLTAPEGHTHSNGRKHPAYTEPSFKTCVLAGFDPGGNQLSTMMPRWEMSNEDLDDLIVYLKTK